ncbi:SMI1/KNR4 family protein [Lignipirellula cremea]|uniref:SMI1 / KNR4 family protein n=1 Tax=Lignipirellula cremea TaxID=2528010 RepID=A0A518DYX6_9BACT|nr:SMI1/KNR4 family protein [Lignipirellula cremea]QDU97048.1 SMI1 / KNR4 family protein [Lignipirellula cremea]
MKNLIDNALDYWEASKLNCHPGDVPSDMLTGETEDDWSFWNAIESKVTTDEIHDLEKHLGVTFPPSYKELLQHRHFIELQIGEVSFFSHPSSGWRASITDAVFGGYPRALLIDKGYMPFANYSDWGLWCFGLNEPNQDGEFPIYQWDHECAEDFVRVANDLQTGLQEQWDNRHSGEE